MATSPTSVISASSPTKQNDEQMVQERSLAHQEHNAYLKRELEAAKREHKAALSLREAIIAQTEAELARERMQRSVLRQRIVRAARSGTPVEGVVEVDWDTELKACSCELFHALAVSSKLQEMSRTGSPCNVNVSNLWEMALDSNLHWRSFRAWIQKQINNSAPVVVSPLPKAAEALRPRTTPGGPAEGSGTLSPLVASPAEKMLERRFLEAQTRFDHE